MFGYITPDTPYLFIKDDKLYKALYCGLCKSIGKGCGQIARTALTYDLTFLSALVHNIVGEDVKIENERCVLHLIKKRPVAAADDITLALGCINTALAYFKLCDDKSDGEIRGVLRHLYKGGYRRVLKKHPEVSSIISKQVKAQQELESSACDVIDAACEPTAVMMKELSAYLLKGFSTPYTEALFYAIGKWVYLVDALDDYDKDVKKGRYNVLFNVYGEACRTSAIKKGEAELTFIFDSLFAQMRESLANIPFKFNHDLTDNIILRGIPLKTRNLFGGRCETRKGAENEQKKS